MTPLNPQAVEDALRARLDAAEARLKKFADAQPLTDNCIELLRQARAKLTGKQFDDVRNFTVQAECLLERAEQSEVTFRKWGWWLALYEAVLLLAFLVLVVVDGRWAPWLLLEWSRSDKVYLAPYGLWGGLGGVAAGLFGLYRHRAARDFDRGYVTYYFLKPILGLMLGPVLYLFARAGMMAVEKGEPQIQRPELIYLGAFILGFSERFTYLLIDRVAGVIFGPGTTTATPQPTVPAPGPPAPPAPPAATGGSSIRVEVVGPEEVAGVSAALRRNGQLVQERTAPDEDGFFTFTGLALGKYQVEVKKPGWRQAATTTAEVKAAGESLDLQVTLERAPEPGPAGTPSGGGGE